MRNRNLSHLILPFSVCCIFAVGALTLFNLATASYNELTQQQLMKFDKLRAIAAFKSNVAEPVQTAGQTPGAELFFTAGTPAVVTAQLLSNLKNIASAHGLDVLRAADLPAKVEGPLNSVGGSVDLSGNMPSVLAFIQDIETTKPALFIEELELHTNRESNADANVETFLNVSVQVYGVIHAHPKNNASGNN